MDNSASYEIEIRRNMKCKGLKSAKNAAVAPPKETQHQCSRLALYDMITDQKSTWLQSNHQRYVSLLNYGHEKEPIQCFLSFKGLGGKILSTHPYHHPEQHSAHHLDPNPTHQPYPHPDQNHHLDHHPTPHPDPPLASWMNRPRMCGLPMKSRLSI